MTRGFMLLVVVCLLAGRAFAVEDGPDDHGQTAQKKDKEKSRQEQEKAEGNKLLEPRFDLGIWSIAVFVLLLLVLRRFAWSPLLEGLKKREQTIRAAVEEGKIAREEAEQAKARFKAESDKAIAEVAKLIEEARHDGEKLVEDMKAKATADIAADRERLRREIDLAKTQLIQDMFNQTAQLATLISANVLARSLTPDDHQRMLGMAMEELKTSGSRFRQDIV